MGDLGTTWMMVAALAAGVLVAAELLRRRARAQRLAGLDRFRVARRLAAADVAALPPGSRRAAAEHLLHDASTSEDVAGVTALLAAGTVPCFFDPRHGPSVLDAAWSPFVGTTWFVPACRADADRLAADQPPRLRLVLRLGQRWVPWFAVGPSLDGYTRGYFGGRVDAPCREAAALAELLADGAGERDIDLGVDAGVGWLGEAPINPHHRLGTAHVKGRRR